MMLAKGLFLENDFVFLVLHLLKAVDVLRNANNQGFYDLFIY